MFGYDFPSCACLLKYIYLSVCLSLSTHYLLNEHSNIVFPIMLAPSLCPQAALHCPGFVCGSLSPEFILQADPRDIQTVPYSCMLAGSLAFWYIMCIPYCLKNNDGRMSPLRNLLFMCCGRWLFLLSRGEQSPPQIGLRASAAPEWD